jgi:hypothetical protein
VTDRSIADRLTDIYTWMREPDWTEEASLEWLKDWINRRPVAELGMVSMLLPKGSGDHAPQAPQPGLLDAEQVEWVVNDIAELGVKIGNQFFWLYKGHSLVYGHSEEERAAGVCLNEDTDPPTKHMWRPVFKREFGECCYPINRKDPTLIGTVSPDDSDEWKPLPPAALPARSAAIAAGPVEVSPLDDTRNPNVLRERRGWGAAPTTSPEPVLGKHFLSAADVPPEIIRDADDLPEPDAVREDYRSIADEIAKARSTFLDSWGTEDGILGKRALEQLLWDNKYTFIEALRLAALSRPAHGGWKAALEEIAAWANPEGGYGKAAAIARAALARNDRGGPAA